MGTSAFYISCIDLAHSLRHSPRIVWRLAFVFRPSSGSFLSVPIPSENKLNMFGNTENKIQFRNRDENRILYRFCISGTCSAGGGTYTRSEPTITSVELNSRFFVGSCAASKASIVTWWDSLCCVENVSRLIWYLSDGLPFLRIGRVCSVSVISLRWLWLRREVSVCWLVIWLAIWSIEFLWHFCELLAEFELGRKCTTSWVYLLLCSWQSCSLLCCKTMDFT